MERAGSVKKSDSSKDKTESKRQDKEPGSKKEKSDSKKSESVKKAELKRQESVDALKVRFHCNYRMSPDILISIIVHFFFGKNEFYINKF